MKKPMFMESLINKHVLVTGGSSGIGLAIARKAIEEQAFVTLISRNASNLARAVEKLVEQTHCSRDRIFCQVADVGNYSSIATAVKEAIRWRPVDVLVCSAGITRGGFLHNSPIEDFELTIRTNLNGTIYALHTALPSMKERSVAHPTSIVIVSSMISLYFMYGHSAYTATKHALRGLAETLRMELVPYNMRVCLSCPFFVNTPFLDDVRSDSETTEVLKRINFLDQESSESPESVASSIIDAVKRGTFLLLTQRIGYGALALGRGMIPADDVWWVLYELVMMVPFRIFSIKFAADIRRDILNVVNKNTKT